MTSVVGFSATDDDGAAKPFGHRKFAFEGIMIHHQVFKEFYNVIVVELFFVEKDS